MKLKRFKQEKMHCAIASAATIANYYNPLVDYNVTKDIAYSVFGITGKGKKKYDGLTSGQIGVLFNNLGFNNVDIVSSDLDLVRYNWTGYSPKKMGKKLLNKADQDIDYYYDILTMGEFLLTKGRRNSLTIDYCFGDIIRNSLKKEIPIIITFNWTMFFRHTPKDVSWESHAVALEGCDAKGVKIVDSHFYRYKGRLKKYASGKYGMSWENLMTVMGTGDVIIPSNYVGLQDYELV